METHELKSVSSDSQDNKNENNDVEEVNQQNRSSSSEPKQEETQEAFKKPGLVCPRRDKSGKVRTAYTEKIKDTAEDTEKQARDITDPTSVIKSCHELQNSSVIKTQPPLPCNVPLTYTEPPWAGKTDKPYKLEVLKSGVILDTINLNECSYHVVGRLPTCSIVLAHPTISRHHAVFQYRSEPDEKNTAGWYIYDLESTHGTFWNGNRIKPRLYVRLHAGHMVKFGHSQRKFILQGPPEDEEEESELSVTELKEKRMLELQRREELERERLLEEEELRLKREKEESEGIDWGMGEDADEETDLTENPYASTFDEEVFHDPKKTLRGWFEREGYDLQYHTEERGIGQFLCWVNLPIEDTVGRPVRGEALVKGKKKEAVIQCATECCRILDSYGLLRQANHEARKRKTRNWEEEDFYDSDEDNYLDRTGTVEKKRAQRMRMAGKLETKVETYNSLLEKHKEVIEQITNLEKCLQSSKDANAPQAESSNEDALDAFMSTLSSSALSKSDMIKMKLDLQGLRKEEAKLVELINLAKPANLPPLIINKTPIDDKSSSSSASKTQQNSISTIRRMTKPHDSTRNQNKRSYTVNPSEQNAPDDTDEEFESDEETNHENENKSNDDQEQRDNACVTENVRDTDTQNSEHSKQEVTQKHTDKAENTADSVPSKAKKVCKEGVKQEKRNQKKEKTAEIGKEYDLNTYEENYSMWLPPQGQTGDGKTSLNDKYGY